MNGFTETIKNTAKTVTAFFGSLSRSVPGGAYAFAALAVVLAAAAVCIVIAARSQRLKQSAPFQMFLAAPGKAGWKRALLAMLKTDGEKIIRGLAASCRGEEFDGEKAFALLGNHAGLLRELTGETEWYVRYFAFRILLADSDPRTVRGLEEGLLDPHPLIRKIIAGGIPAGEQRERSFGLLWERLSGDPVFEVREAAKNRIKKDYGDLYNPRGGNGAEETARILELLDPASREDRAFALEYLESDDKELRYHAAAFLEKCGILDRLLRENSLDDPEGIKRNERLLRKAAEVKVTGFLSRIPGDFSAAASPPRDTGAALLVASRLLAEGKGTQGNLLALARGVFGFFSERKPEGPCREIYTLTAGAVSSGGGEALSLLLRELERREHDADFLELLLPALPRNAEHFFLPVLFRFLEDPAFPARETLIAVLGNFSPDSLLPEMFKILNTGRKYPRAVRISALRILGSCRLPYCLSRVLESLPALSREDQKNFAAALDSCPPDMLEEKASALFRSPDGQIRAGLLTVLPLVKSVRFIKEARNCLRDADPDVRIAAIEALLEYGEIKLLNQETSMLRDPVERVRVAAASCIARHGGATETLKAILEDPNETDTVKRSIIGGLGNAENAESLEILASVLERGEEFAAAASEALALRNNRNDLKRLTGIFRDASPAFRERLVSVFKKAGKDAEEEILAVLREDIASLKPFFAKILEETGYVGSAIRRLSHRNAQTRREAAAVLSLLDTLPAFRGLVLAAKDPDQEVRILVVRALEKLKTAEGRETLEKLQEDPDGRVRKYTAWALERLDALMGE
jgi:HEAT repeat protein